MHQGRPVIGLSGLDYPEEGMDAVPTYATKDSGQRAEYASGMVRDTQDGKPRWDLIFAGDMPYDLQPLTRWAALMGRGADKYGEKNWLKGDGEAERDRALSSACRHFAQWVLGQVDEDHLAATWFNMQAVAYFEWKMGGSDGH